MSTSVTDTRAAPSVTEAGTPTSVLVVDDHTTFSDLVAMALDHEPDLTCIGTAANVAGALALAADLRPDLVLMDVHLGTDDGIIATSELTRLYPELRVVVLTAHIESTLMQRAADAGACALLPKDGSLPDLLAALRSSRHGGFHVHPALLKNLITSKPPSRDLLPPLTPRELEVLRSLADGSDVRAIAKSLGISVSTCRGYVKNLLMKLDAHTQLEAVVIASNRGLVSVGPRR
jgi:DNA-binding NarL/FixJ family response regulator